MMRDRNDGMALWLDSNKIAAVFFFDVSPESSACTEMGPVASHFL